VPAQRHDIVIVGAGPVGFTAAAALSDQGIPVTVVERSPVPQQDWRASTFHAATLEILERIGVTDDMLRLGLQVPRFQYRDRTEGLIAEFDFTQIADVTRYPFRLQLNQQRLVGLLFDRLKQRDNVTLRFNSQVTNIDDSGDDHVAVELATESGTETLKASYVLGADGATSTVRQSLGIEFDGMTYPQRFLIASVAEEIDDLIPGIAPVCYVSDPEEWLFLLRTPESWRIVMPVQDSEAELDDLTIREPSRVKAKLNRVATAPGGFTLVDTQVYRVHQRVAAEFRRGRVMLAGDAGHINSPLGGMGLNSGIHDAIDLSIRMGRLWDATDAVVDSELSTYADRRRRVALDFVGADTHRNTVMMQEKDESVRQANQADLRATAADPERSREWLMRASLIAAVRSHGIGAPPELSTV
jgi:2-polyprenyl-6-methoxyphenol hydroxylase-like FAD-dependent oxidoreductase